MYLQLKQQFHEKCETLDATMRELFQLSEEILKNKKESEEEHSFGLPTGENLLQQHILKLDRELEQTRRQDQQEIDALVNLVGELLKQIK